MRLKRALIEPVTDSAYAERGQLAWGDYRKHGLNARFATKPTIRDEVVVLFADGRLFHRLEMRAEGFWATHRCGDDLYEGHFVARKRRALECDVDGAWTAQVSRVHE